MTWLLRLFGYWPHRHLTTPGVVGWLLVVFGLSATIATIEATFFGLTIFEFTASRYLAVVVAGAWFGLTYCLDRVISLSDTSRAQTRMTALVGLLARCGAMSLLFLVAAPQVRQLAIEPEVLHYQQQQRIAERARLLQAEESKHSAALASLQTEIDAVEAKLTTEISGNGESRMRGHGATAQNIESRLARKREEYSKARELADKELGQLKTASDETLARNFGVQFPGDGYAERRRIAEKLLNENRAYGDTANLAKYLLSGLFLLFIAAKILEGEEVRVYLSGRLQSLYGSYLLGAFNAYLPPLDQPQNSQMDAARFVSWVKANPDPIASLDNPAMCRPLGEPKLYAELTKDEERIEQQHAACTGQLQQTHVATQALERTWTQLGARRSSLATTLRETEQRRLDLLRGTLHTSAAHSQRQSLLMALDLEIAELHRELRTTEGELQRTELELAQVSHDRNLLEHRLRALETEREQLFQVVHRLRLRKNEVFDREADACLLKPLGIHADLSEATVLQ